MPYALRLFLTVAATTSLICAGCASQKAAPDDDPATPVAEEADSTASAMAEAAEKSEDAPCDASLPRDCVERAQELQNPDGSFKDMELAKKFVTHGCAAENGPSCAMLGDLRRRSSDFAGAAQAYAQGCELGARAACARHGTMVMKGAYGDADPDYNAALTTLGKACSDMDDGVQLTEAVHQAHGCAGLAHMYQHGKGVTQDEARALEYWEFACDHDPASCMQAGTFYEQGVGTQADDAKAVAYYHRGCKREDAVSCCRLAKMLGRDEDLSAPEEKMYYFERATEIGGIRCELPEEDINVIR